MLAGIGQVSVAKTELRRYLELILWTIYFTDHPREWKEFEKKGSGFARDVHRPISYAAHRELVHYLDYARELMHGELSGAVKESIDLIRQSSHVLNAAVHPGQLARTKGKLAPFESPSAQTLKEFARLQRDVFSGSCVLVAAFQISKFNSLNASAKAHFEWLLRPRLRKQIKTGPFGLL